MQEIQEGNAKKRWTRQEVAGKIIDFEQAAQHLASQRQLAEEPVRPAHDRFVAASYSSHQEVSAAMEEAVVEFGKPVVSLSN